MKRALHVVAVGAAALAMGGAPVAQDEPRYEGGPRFIDPWWPGPGVVEVPMFPGVADDPSLPSPIDVRAECTGPGATPLCAFKTYAACVLYDDVQACADAGFPDYRGRFPGPETIDANLPRQAWAKSLDEVMPEAYGFVLRDGGFVPPARLATYSIGQRNGNPVYETEAFELASAEVYELIAEIMELDVAGWEFQLNFLFTREDGAWRLARWGSTRKRPCSAEAETAQWFACTKFARRLIMRDVYNNDFPVLWASPTSNAAGEYLHNGLDIAVSAAGESVASPIDGQIVRRAQVYLDTPEYDWVVIDGHGPFAGLMIKFAFVDRQGPRPGADITMAQPIGRHQSLVPEYPGISEFIHMEALWRGVYIDPKTLFAPPLGTAGQN